MRVLAFNDAHHFLERARGFLFRDEARHNLLLSSSLTLAKNRPSPSSTSRPASLLFLVTDDNGGAALRSPNHRWIVDADHVQAASALAREITAREISGVHPFRSLMLPNDLAESFTATSAPLALSRSSLQNLMSLNTLGPIDPSPGLLRFALAKDLKLLSTWSRHFAEEGQLDESPREAEEAIQKYIETKQLFIWENQRKPVAMTAVGGFTPRSARISMVYTEPTQRGHGYASTLVHRVSHKVLQDGKTCVLFADHANPKTKYVYEKLGYRTLSQFCELKQDQT